MTDPTEEKSLEELASVDWWTKLKAADADEVKKAKELCTSGNLKKLAHESLDAATTFLDTMGIVGNVAAGLLSPLSCMDGVHVNNINLEKLKDRCFALMELLLHLRESGAFISTSRSSSELPKRSQDLTRIMCRVHSLLEEVKAYCNAYSREGMMAAAGRFLLQSKHKEKYDELIAELRDLTGGLNSVQLQAKPKGNTPHVAPVKKERALKAHQAQPEQGRRRVSPVQGGAQLFLSYRVPETGRKEQGGDCTVPQLKSALEAHGYSVFVGESDIEGGASWAQAIQVAITDCQVFIPVCSKTYGETKWTLRELHEADEANKEILPLWHSGDYPPKKVSMYLRSVQRLPRGNQPLVQANFQSLVSDLVAAIKNAGCLPRNPPGPSNQALQGLALDQGRRRT